MAGKPKALTEADIKKKIPGYKADFVEGLEFVWSDVQIYYAQIFEDNFDTYEGKQRYVLKVLVPEEKVESMAAAGFNVRNFEGENIPDELEGRMYIEAYKYKVTLRGREQEPPTCGILDENGDKIIYDGKGIGNGSTANINVFAKYVKVGGAIRLPLYLNGVLITELVPYSGGGKRSLDDMF